MFLSSGCCQLVQFDENSNLFIVFQNLFSFWCFIQFIVGNCMIISQQNNNNNWWSIELFIYLELILTSDIGCRIEHWIVVFVIVVFFWRNKLCYVDYSKFPTNYDSSNRLNGILTTNKWVFSEVWNGGICVKLNWKPHQIWSIDINHSGLCDVWANLWVAKLKLVDFYPPMASIKSKHINADLIVSYDCDSAHRQASI